MERTLLIINSFTNLTKLEHHRNAYETLQRERGDLFQEELDHIKEQVKSLKETL